ncbi:MAG: response regulator transcription factor [Polyangia bacterium]
MTRRRSKRCRVLLMDDQRQLRNVLGRAIGKKHLVETAASAEEALEKLAAERFDLALLDISMGDGETSGLECLWQVPSTGHRGTVCILTGYLSCELLHEALLAGADDYLIKVSEDRIMAEVNRLAQLGRLPPDKRPRYETIADMGLLRSLEMNSDQIALLGRMLRSGFPTQAELAAEVGISEKALEARLKRIRNKFGAGNTTQLARYLVVLGGYVRHSRLEWGEGETDIAPLIEGATLIGRPLGGRRKEGG